MKAKEVKKVCIHFHSLTLVFKPDAYAHILYFILTQCMYYACYKTQLPTLYHHVLQTNKQTNIISIFPF